MGEKLQNLNFIVSDGKQRRENFIQIQSGEKVVDSF
jgi:hypothetical protein